MVKSPTSKGGKAAPAARTRVVHPPYDQAVRATLQGGQRDEIQQMLEGVKRLRSEYGDIDSLINRLEAALGAER